MPLGSGSTIDSILEATGLRAATEIGIEAATLMSVVDQTDIRAETFLLRVVEQIHHSRQVFLRQEHGGRHREATQEEERVISLQRGEAMLLTCLRRAGALIDGMPVEDWISHRLADDAHRRPAAMWIEDVRSLIRLAKVDRIPAHLGINSLPPCRWFPPGSVSYCCMLLILCSQ